MLLVNKIGSVINIFIAVSSKCLRGELIACPAFLLLHFGLIRGWLELCGFCQTVSTLINPILKRQTELCQVTYCTTRAYYSGTFVLPLLKAKFHYASWFGASSELASVKEFGF